MITQDNKNINKNNKKICVIIAAAGNSTRMNFDGDKSKQFIEICGKSVIERSVSVFNACALVDEIVIVTREQDIAEIKKIVSDANLKKVTHIIKGGKTRRESVLNALSVLSEDINYIAIHDGARCLISLDDIEKVIKKAFETGAAAAANKITDTIKYVNGGDIIKNTVDRNFLWAVQTPQVFLKELYITSVDYVKNIAEDIDITDDCSILEYAGHNVSVVECSKDNIKITEKEDIKLAEAILKYSFH